MAYKKYDAFLEQNYHEAFDTINEPGNLAPFSGIYRCEGCGHEVTSEIGNPLPPQNHAQHNGYLHGTIRWRLIVATHHAG